MRLKRGCKRKHPYKSERFVDKTVPAMLLLAEAMTKNGAGCEKESTAQHHPSDDAAW